MPLRNPFTRRTGAIGDENLHPEHRAAPGFERVDTVGSKTSSALSIRSGRDTGEYKMSVVNDSGVYLPPSPPEEKGPWPRKYLSRTSTETRSSFGDIEHFSISRESFDSYRRSFDISARSPIAKHDVPTRGSLDSHHFPRLPRSARDRKIDPPAVEEAFEEVGLDDQKNQPSQPLRKRGFFSKFGDGQEKDAMNQGAVSRFLIPGRKRAQSGQGAELNHIEQHPRVVVTTEGRDAS